MINSPTPRCSCCMHRLHEERDAGVTHAAALLEKLVKKAIWTRWIFRQSKQQQHTKILEESLVLKRVLNELPGKLVPRRLTDRLLAVIPNVELARQTISQMPIDEWCLFFDLIGLLRMVARNKDTTLMDEANISACLSSSIFDFSPAAMQSKASNKLLIFSMANCAELMKRRLD